MSATVVKTEQVPLEKLSPYPYNARRGNVEVIRESLRVNGQYKPIVVQKSTGHVLAGNHTLEAARAEGDPNRPPSPPPEYDSTGKRTNSREQRMTKAFTLARDALCEKMADLNPSLVAGVCNGCNHDVTHSVRSILESPYNVAACARLLASQAARAGAP